MFSFSRSIGDSCNVLVGRCVSLEIRRKTNTSPERLKRNLQHNYISTKKELSKNFLDGGTNEESGKKDLLELQKIK